MRTIHGLTLTAVALALVAGTFSDPASARRRTTTPEPTPTPTPAPTTLNGVLLEHLYETDGSKRGLHSTSAPTAITYDTTSQTYVMHEQSGTQLSFSASEIDAAASTPGYAVYRDTATGVRLDLLNQGSANPLIALSHVRYGKWSRPVTPSTGYTSAQRTDWMVFGAMTPAASVPRTGSATYAAILDGNYYDKNGAYTLSGTAGLTADFASGGLSMFINPKGTNVASGAIVDFGGFRGTGTIDFAAGSFAGSNYSSNYSFSYRGNFYGPAAEEVGGSFSLNTVIALGGGMGGGIFVGKHGALPAASPEPVPPPPPLVYGPKSFSVEQVWTGSSGQTTAGSGGATIAFDSATGTYVVKERDGTSFTFTSDERVDAESTPALAVYRDGASGTTFRQLNASDPTVALTYVSYGSWRRTVMVNNTPVEKVVHVAYGSPTLVSAMPKTGSATYNAALAGAMTTAKGLGTLSGSAVFKADFATGQIGYTLSPTLSLNGQNVAVGDMVGAGTISGAAFNGRGSTPLYYSNLSGGFFGPNAEEVGGSFTYSANYGAPVTGAGAGVFVGKH